MDYLTFTSSIAWPTVTVLAGWAFRKEIIAFLGAAERALGRIKKLPGGVELEQETPSAAPNGNTPTELQAPNSQPTDPSLEPWITAVRSAIREKNIEDAPDLKETLIHAVAFARRHALFVRVGLEIFGTQFAALKELNMSGPLPSEALHKIHAEHQLRVSKETTEKPLDFLLWLSFLRNVGLVIMNATGSYEITDSGKMFLIFAEQEGLSEAKKF